MEIRKKCASLLIVEDEEGLREALVEILKLEGFHSYSAGNGREALDLLKKIPKPCLILLDMMMPIMNGRAFLDELLVDSTLFPIPVLIVSAFDNPNTKGAIGVMRKPVDWDQLIKVISEYCSPDLVDSNRVP